VIADDEYASILLGSLPSSDESTVNAISAATGINDKDV
jgi:hypothetical protein